MDTFQLATGTTPGRDHLGRGQVLKGLNNQDGASLLLPSENPLLYGAIVSDGCGSGAESEVGARQGPDILFAQALRLYPQFRPSLANSPSGYTFDPLRSDFWVALHAAALRSIDQAITNQVRPGRPYKQVLRERYLFTVIGALIDPEIGAWIFYDSDGVYAVNGEVTVLESTEQNASGDNKPSYWTYALEPTNEFYRQRERTAFKVKFVPLVSLNSLVIGTDGVADLIKAQDQTVPGKQSLVGPLSQFWEDDQFFNPEFPEAISVRLRLLNREPFDRENGVYRRGLLPDDTTLAVIRRQSIPEESSESPMP